MSPARQFWHKNSPLLGTPRWSKLSKPPSNRFDGFKITPVQSRRWDDGDDRPANLPETIVPKLELSQLCDILNQHGLATTLDGEDRTVHAVNTLESAAEGEVTFLSNPRYTDALVTTKASAVILKPGIDAPAHLSCVRAEDPYAALTGAIVAIHGHRQHPEWGVSDRASIDPSAAIGHRANIAPGATVGANANLGDNCTLYPGAYVGEGTTLGNDCTLFPNAVVYDKCVLGNRVTIHAGSVVGQDGLGYAPVNEKWLKIPQIGRTVIGDDVEIGANCAIDRATLGQTEIGEGTKFGNVIVIGHGTRVGPDCLFVGLVGLAGSVTVGRHVTLGGQTGSAGHLTIGDNVRAGARSGIARSVPPNTEILGTPATPIADARRSMMAMAKLPEWINRIKALEQELKELKAKLADAETT